MFPAPITARFDPSLSTRILGRRPLLHDGPARDGEHLPFVRAASGIAVSGPNAYVVQDDALFVGIVSLDTHRTRSVPLPAPGGERLFERARGNKNRKPDFEACFAATIDGRPTIVALGSGSHPARERVLFFNVETETARIFDASALYATLRETKEFAGSELNLEGAVLVGESLRLFQRGNGAVHGDLRPVDATCDLGWRDLLACLLDDAPPPTPTGVRAYRLGTLDGVRITFTDATLTPDGSILYLGAAEGSPNAIDDGEVQGTVLGILDADGEARHGLILDERGERSKAKVEGIALLPGAPSHALLVVDDDDTSRPSELLVADVSEALREVAG